MNVERAVIEIIEGKRKNDFLKAALYLLSKMYGIGVRLRNNWYDRFRSPVKVDAKVISIGNIVAGGSGKTPMVCYLSSLLRDRFKVAILTRGYRSHVERTNQVVLLKDENQKECGDEPQWLSQKLPNIPIWVGKDRARSAKEAVKNGSNLLILDDGMQHRNLHRDVEIVMMDASDLFGKGYYLPRGYLRDDPKRLAFATLIVVHPIADEKDYEDAVKALRPFTSAPIAGAAMTLENTQELQGKKVGLFCGIAKPERFLRSVKKEGIDVVGTLFTPDHQIPNKEDLAVFAERVKEKGAGFLVCTEKDFVKLDDTPLPLPVAAIAAKWVITQGEGHINKMIESLGG